MHHRQFSKPAGINPCRRRLPTALLPALLACVGICGGENSLAGNLRLPEEIFPELRAVIDTAMHSAPVLTIETLLVNQMEANRKVRASSLYPKLHFSTDVGGRRKDIGSVSSTEGQARYNLTLIQPLYHWGSLQAEKQIGEIELDLAHIGRVRSYLNLYAQLNSVFLDLVVQNQAVKKAQLDSELSAERLESARNRMEGGDLPAGVFQEQSFAHREKGIELRRANGTLENLRRRFRALAGLNEEYVLHLPEEIPTAAFDLDSIEKLVEDYRRVMAEQSLELKTLVMQEAIEEENLSIHQNRLKPKINLVARSLQDVETVAPILAEDLERREIFAGINVDWQIFDGWASRGRKEITLERIRQRQTDYGQTRSRILASLQYLDFNLKLDYEMADISDKRYLRQKEIYSQKEKDFAEGMISPDAFAAQRLRLEQDRLNALRNRADLYQSLTFLLVQVQYAKIMERL